MRFSLRLLLVNSCMVLSGPCYELSLLGSLTVAFNVYCLSAQSSCRMDCHLKAVNLIARSTRNSVSLSSIVVLVLSAFLCYARACNRMILKNHLQSTFFVGLVLCVCSRPFSACRVVRPRLCSTWLSTHRNAHHLAAILEKIQHIPVFVVLVELEFTHQLSWVHQACCIYNHIYIYIYSVHVYIYIYICIYIHI